MTNKELAKKINYHEKQAEKLKKQLKAQCEHRKTFYSDCIDGYMGKFCSTCYKRMNTQDDD